MASWEFVLLKLVVTIGVVTALSIIAERASPRLAGVLSGFPVGTAITLTFIGLENGSTFAAESALHNIVGMPAMLCMLYLYAWVAGAAQTGALLLAALGSTVVFLAGTVALHALNLPVWVSLLISAACIPLFTWLCQRFPDAPIVERVRMGKRVLLFRAAVSAAVVLAITGAAGVVGASWAGLFTSFPATVFPLLLILQRAYGPQPAQTVIKNIPRGLWALLAFTLTLSLAEPRLGVGWGTVVAFTAALAALGLVMALARGR